MRSATRAPRATEAPHDAEPTAARRFLVAAAGPALIVVAVLLALRGIAFLPRLPDQHPDLLSFWLPRSCLLGRALADGRVPLWNPFEMAGTPFAADPQSGWLSLPTMLLSRVFGCGGGLRAIVVLNPILAGLGLRWFLRKEGLGRIAATAGGLSVAMAIAASTLAISLPFAGALAWTTLVLVGAAGTFSATGWRRLGWVALAAFAWGQVATSHLSHGLVMATGLTLAYVVARAFRDVRSGSRSSRNAVLLSAGFLLFLALANVAIWFPRFDAIAASSLGDGYRALEGTLARGAGELDRPIADDGIWAGWPLGLASTPGAYVGAVILLCVPFAFRDAARRYLVGAFVAFAGLSYLLTLTLVVRAGWFRSVVLALPFGDVYLHNPGRLRFVAYLVVPALGALGIQWLLDVRPSFADAIRWIAGGLLVLVLLPVLGGAHPERLVIFALAAGAVIVVVRALARGRRWAPLALCGVLTVELLAGALWSSAYEGGTTFTGLEGTDGVLLAGPLRWPDVDLNRYLEPGEIVGEIAAGPAGARYLAWVPPDAYFTKGYLFAREEPEWPALLIGRSVLFEEHDVLGYSPIQLPRYWAYIRATNRLPVFYNASVIQVPTSRDLRLLGARYLVVRDGQSLPPGLSGEVVATEGAYRLIEVAGAQPRVSVVPAWTVVPDAGAALREVVRPDFDPAVVAVLEEDPGDRSDARRTGGVGDLPGAAARDDQDRRRRPGTVDRRGPQRLGRRVVGHRRRAPRSAARHGRLPPRGGGPGRDPRDHAGVPRAGARSGTRGVDRRVAGVPHPRAADGSTGPLEASRRRVRDELTTTEPEVRIARRGARAASSAHPAERRQHRAERDERDDPDLDPRGHVERPARRPARSSRWTRRRSCTSPAGRSRAARRRPRCRRP